MTYIRQERVARSTGTTVQVLDLADPESEFESEVDDLGAVLNQWATVCVDHGIICTHPTLRLARWHAPAPEGWCEPCQEASP